MFFVPKNHYRSIFCLSFELLSNHIVASLPFNSPRKIHLNFISYLLCATNKGNKSRRFWRLCKLKFGIDTKSDCAIFAHVNAFATSASIVCLVFNKKNRFSIINRSRNWAIHIHWTLNILRSHLQIMSMVHSSNNSICFLFFCSV